MFMKREVKTLQIGYLFIEMLLFIHVVFKGTNGKGVLGPGWMDVERSMHVVREDGRMYVCVGEDLDDMAGTHFGLGGRGGWV